jgi:hypothetical protein
MTPDLVQDAQALIRALSGVMHASVRGSDREIEAIHVTADPDSAPHIAGHVRSALLAGLAAPVTPTMIHVRVREPDEGEIALPRHRLRVVDDTAAGPRPDPLHTPASEPDPIPAARTPMPEYSPALAPPETGRTPQPRSDQTHDAEDGDVPFTTRPRLVAVDVERPGDGRVRCRVAVAYGAQVHRADALAVDLPGAAAQAAAQAAVRALLDAGFDGLELLGLRDVEIAGRDYVVVALRRSNVYTRIRSGSAPVIGPAERSAAEATVAAASKVL